MEQWDGWANPNPPPLAPDWGIARLDRKVAGRVPLQIKETTSAPNTNLFIIGHPNSIPMKIEQVQLQTGSWSNGYFASTGHILPHSSGSMVIDPISNEVVGTVYSGANTVGEGCSPAFPPFCTREDFASTGGVNETAAYLAKDYIQ